ncbi:MAG: DUF6206 family protein [Acidimicrobiia bacterium]|nr:DUF6206 family protein [Acidimicrobiia bacterium]
MRPTTADLTALEEQVEAAFAGRDAENLAVLGYGEISTVLRLDLPGASFAAKRLPPFPDQASFDAYAVLFFEYITTLESRGIEVVPSELHSWRVSGSEVAAYCLQPLIDQGRLLTEFLRDCDQATGLAIVEQLAGAILAVTGSSVGFDGQLSNWVLGPQGRVAYFDVTTPLLRDGRGKDRLDTGVFLASLPWALRGSLRLIVPKLIIDAYHRPRSVLVDLAANFHKERLTEWIPALIEAANARVEPPITEVEVARYYRSDARMWAVLQSLRKADRWWQRSIRRRPYRFLLPTGIER